MDWRRLRVLVSLASLVCLGWWLLYLDMFHFPYSCPDHHATLLPPPSSPSPLQPCPHSASVPLLSEQHQSARLYTEAGHDFLAADELPEEGLAPLTRQVQRLIWHHQHPKEGRCASAKYLLHSWSSGMGSQVHVAGASLASAISDNMIWSWTETAGSHFVNAAVCGEIRNWLCFFRPPTNCSLANAKHSNTIRDTQVALHASLVPKVFVEELGRVAPWMNADDVKYWWRAQSVAYLMRLNDRTVRALAILRKAEHMVRIGGKPVPAQAQLLHQPVFPLPAGVVSLHVRHGDKGTEMTLVPWSAYQTAAERLFKMQPLFLQRTMFVSTEDPGVVRDANATKDWTTLHSDIPRHNSNGQKQMELADNMGLLHLAQLLMALECDAWVGTRGSNWNRLIDELRCVWVAKCSHPYVEVGRDEDWKHYRW